jgi:aryl-alcohol dehydrogenase-like predicted oxidoreductase
MIEKYPFGSTGYQSSRVIFGAAALSAMKQDEANAVLELLLEYGINH